MSTKARATVDDLYNVPEHGKAELVNGELVLMSPTGDMPGRAGLRICVSLGQIEHILSGRAYPDNVGFLVNLPNRESFSPDAAFYTGPRSGLKFLRGAPVFAAEVRSEGENPSLGLIEIVEDSQAGCHAIGDLTGRQRMPLGPR